MHINIAQSNILSARILTQPSIHSSSSRHWSATGSSLTPTDTVNLRWQRVELRCDHGCDRVFQIHRAVPVLALMPEANAAAAGAEAAAWPPPAAEAGAQPSRLLSARALACLLRRRTTAVCTP